MERLVRTLGRVTGAALSIAIALFAVMLVSLQAIAGTNVWTTGGPYGGRASALAVSPAFAADQTVFAGTSGSGVFKSTDGGQTWTAVNTGLNDMNVVAIVVSPNYAADQTVFIATFINRVFKSTNGGSSWTAMNSGIANQSIYSLAISPNYAVDQTVYVGAGYNGGVFKSTNGGATWLAVNNGINTSGYIRGFALSPNYATDQTVYAASDGRGVYRSVNGGSTWSAVNSGFSYLSIQAIVISPGFPADQTLYAASPGGVFKSVNGGTSWSAVNSGLTYFSYTALAISPNYAADQTLYAATPAGIFRTVNGAAGWSAANAGIQDTNIRSLAISPGFAADQTVFSGSFGGGVNKSVDGGTGWAVASNGITNLQVYALAVSPDYAADGTVFAGTYGDKVYKSTDRGASWSGSGTGISATTVNALALSPGYATDATLFAGTAGSGVYKSTNGGATWSAVNNGLTHMTVYALALSPDFAFDQTLFASTSYGIHKSTDGGSSWTVANTGLTNLYVYALAISPAFPGDGVVYAGGLGGVFRSTDGGVTWSSVRSGSDVRSLALSPGYATDHTVYAGMYYGDGVHKSADGGSSWTRTAIGSTYEYFYSLVLSPDYVNDQTLYAGSNNGGVYKSSNGGASASAVNTGLSNLLIQSLAISPDYAADQTVFAGNRNTAYSYRNTFPTTTATAGGYRYGTWTSATSVELTLAANDHSGTGIASGYPQVCVDAINICTPSAAYQTPVSVACSAGSACSQYVRYRSADNAGNVETIGSFRVMQDSSAPSTAASPAGGAYTAPFTATLQCTDTAGGGCAATYYTTDGSDPTASSPVFSLPISINGPTTLKFRSVDQAGNWEPGIRTEVYILIAGSAALTAGPARVQMTGSPAVFTASAQGGTGSYEFEFWMRKNSVATWTKVQDYGVSNAWTWDTTGSIAGIYSVKVHVRCTGSAAAYEAQTTLVYSLVTDPPATGATLVADPAGPRAVGAPVVFTAGGQGGSSDYEYRFLLRSSTATTSSTVQNYSSQNVWTWDTAQFAAGTYTVTVYVRNAGSAAAFEAIRSMTYPLAAVAPATGVTLQANIASPAMRQQLQLTAAAQGGTGNYEYRFLVKSHATGTWTVLQEYLPDPVCWWSANDSSWWPAGKYTVQVMVRSFGSGTDYDVLKSMDYIISDVSPATSVDLTTDVASPASRQVVTFTAAGYGGFGSYEYKYLLKSDASTAWTVVRDYQEISTWSWDLSDSQLWPAGKYSVQVMARALGSNTEYDVYRSADYIVSNTIPAASVDLTSSISSPVFRASVRFTAATIGTNWGIDYRYLIKRSTDSAWTVARGYEQDPAWVWSPIDSQQWPAGQYLVQVQARGFGSGTEYDSLDTMEFIVADMIPVSSVDLTADMPSPFQRQPVLFTATATGTQSVEYKFLVKSSAGGAWTVMRDYSYDRQWTWDTSNGVQWPAGKYTVQVMARSTMSNTEYDAFKNMELMVSDNAPATAVSLTADRTSPAQRGLVTFTAAAEGGSGNYEYKFLVKRSTSGAWNLLRPDYLPDPVCQWYAMDAYTFPAGKYTIQVMARSMGSNTDYDVMKTMDFIISDTMPATSVDLVADAASPVLRRTVNFTASAAGGTGSYEYKFLVKSSAGGAWTVMRDYGIAQWPWETSSSQQWPAGQYTIQVMARSIGSNTDYDVLANREIVLADATSATSVVLSSDASSPAQRRTITFTAAAQGGGGPYDYQFMVKRHADSDWTIVRQYMPDASWTWYASTNSVWPAGAYTVRVMARNWSSGVAFEVMDSMEFILSDTVPAASADLGTNVASPTIRQPVMFTAAAQGGTGSYEYRFLVRSAASGMWQEGRDYQADAGWMWLPFSPQWPAGRYTIQVMARSVGSNTEYDVVKSVELIVSDTTPATSVAVTADRTSPSIREVVNFTAAAEGGTGTYEYRFLMKPAVGGAWGVMSDYGQNSGMVPWLPYDGQMWPAGRYLIQVQARSYGSNTEYDVITTRDFTITDTPPATGAMLGADLASPQVRGASIVFTAGGFGGVEPYEYKFFRKDPGATSWTLLRGYSTDNTFTWDTAGLAAGSHSVLVQVRSAGSTAAAEASRSVTYKLTDTPATGATLTPDPAGPKPAGTAVTFTAAGAGSGGSYEYKFFRKDPGAATWTLVRNYTTNNILTWDTTGLAPGTYSFLVHVRTAGSTAAYDTFKAVSYRLE